MGDPELAGIVLISILRNGNEITVSELLPDEERFIN
jgi:hypothetical protein